MENGFMEAINGILFGFSYFLRAYNVRLLLVSESAVYHNTRSGLHWLGMHDLRIIIQIPPS